MLLSVIISSTLISISYGGCGHYIGTPLNTCTEITNTKEIQQSFMYTCNASAPVDNKYQKWEYNTSDCSGTTLGILVQFHDECGSTFVTKCSCDDILDCDIATTRSLINCDETQYTQESYLINQCIGTSSTRSDIKICGDTEDIPIITNRFDNEACDCSDESLQEDDVICSIEKTGSNELCPRYFKYPIGECAFSEPWKSYKYICETDGNGGFANYISFFLFCIPSTCFCLLFFYDFVSF